MAGERTSKGLGGWLILVGLGIIISPLRIISQVFPVYSEIISSGSWTTLTTPGSDAYNPLWGNVDKWWVASRLDFYCFPILYKEKSISEVVYRHFAVHSDVYSDRCTGYKGRTS
jgi:Protein of unknown function (DUF2569)